MDNKLEDLKRLTFTELKEILESVDEAINAEKIFLGEVKDAYIQDEELWFIYNLQLTKVKDLVDKKNKRPMFNENQLIRVKKGINDLILWNRRRNNIIEEIKRREWGVELFENINLKDLRQNKSYDTELEAAEIKFATPRLNRDERIIELNEEIANLEYQKMRHKDDLEYVKSTEGLINGRKKELDGLTIHLIGDFLLKNKIKEMIRNEFEKSKNITGVNYLNEIDYDKLKNYLIEEGSSRIYNMITNNEFEKKLDDAELFSLINQEIQKVLPELDKRFINGEHSNRIVQFKKLWEQIVNSNFKTDTIIKILDEVGYDNEDEFILYIKRMFRRQTLDEWMKYFEKLDKASQHKTLKDHHLPVEDHIRNQNKIMNAVYETSDVGREAKSNLEKFVSKYIGNVKDKNKDDFKSNITDSIIGEGKTMDLFFDRDQIFKELEKLEFNKRYSFINATLIAIDEFFVGKSFFELPIHIRALKRQLEGQQLIYKNLKNVNMDAEPSNGLKIEKKDLLDQDSVIEKFKVECVKRNLKKDKTIPLIQLYEIAKAIGFNVPEIEYFKAKEKNYQEAREYASRLGYKRKKLKEPPLEE